MKQNEFHIPETKAGEREEASMPYHPGSESSPEAILSQARHAKLMGIEGVEGVGIGQDAIGNEAIVVYARDREAAKRVPSTVDGINVVVEVTGPIHALKP